MLTHLRREELRDRVQTESFFDQEEHRAVAG